jgi:DNA-binding NtrC family response regulator
MSPATLTAKRVSRAPLRAPRPSRILVAGADPRQRAAVLQDLSEALPANTQIGEAGAAWEVLEQAPSSSVVMLAGDLGEVSAESLMQVLGSRHPSLPVIALGLAEDRGSRAAVSA